MQRELAKFSLHHRTCKENLQPSFFCTQFYTVPPSTVLCCRSLHLFVELRYLAKRIVKLKLRGIHLIRVDWLVIVSGVPQMETSNVFQSWLILIQYKNRIICLSIVNLLFSSLLVLCGQVQKVTHMLTERAAILFTKKILIGALHWPKIRACCHRSSHRAVTVGRHLWDHPVKLLCWKQGHLELVAQDLIQSHFEYLQPQPLWTVCSSIW